MPRTFALKEEGQVVAPVPVVVVEAGELAVVVVVGHGDVTRVTN